MFIGFSRASPDQDAIKKIHDLIKKNWDIFRTHQKIMAAESNKYPDINFEVVNKHLKLMQTNQTDMSGKKSRQSRGELEIMFQSATRNDAESGGTSNLSGQMGRGEMLEILVRYSKSTFSSKDQVANFDRFIE